MQKVSQKKSKQIVEKYELDNIDQLLLYHLTASPDTPLKELALLTGYSITGIRKRLKKPSLNKALSEVQQATDQALKALAHRAIRKISELIDTENKKIALEACKLALTQHTLRSPTEADQGIREVIYRTRFGENGQLISEKEEIPYEGPKNTLELLQGCT